MVAAANGHSFTADAEVRKAAATEMHAATDLRAVAELRMKLLLLHMDAALSLTLMLKTQRCR